MYCFFIFVRLLAPISSCSGRVGGTEGGLWGAGGVIPVANYTPHGLVVLY